MNTHTADTAYKLIRSKRRTMSIFVSCDGEITVRAPLRTPESRISAFVAQKSGWISSRLAAVQATRRKYPPVSFCQGESVPFMGRELTLCIAAVRSPREQDGCILLPKNKDIKRSLYAFYNARAREEFESSVAYWCGVMGLCVPEVRLSSAKTRWGSRSASGVNLNLRLILLPPRIIEYVVIHELSHTRHMDHSAAFWAEVKKYCPDYAACRKWLRTEGTAAAARVPE